MVKEVRVDQVAGQGLRARGVSYFDGNDRLQFQTADTIVVSCGAIESARLLLNSTSRWFPRGIGNRYDWVGRNLQGHAYSGAVGLFDTVTYDDLGPGAGVAVCDYNHGNAGLRGGGMLANEFIRLPYQFTGVRPRRVPSWGAAHKEYMRRYYRRAMSVKGPVQEMPVFDARVEVDLVVKDFWGIPVARLSGRQHPHTLELARFLAARAEEWLQAAGATETWRTHPGGGLTAGQHQAGTCRMGNDRQTSVVDRTCRVHDMDNLYVVDGSVHVTNGGFNPVLTIMALAYHAADHIRKQKS
jgi:choline dehydrogenase-like flavoprotein